MVGIIDLIALLASIANDASQTSSQVDDREELDLATDTTVQANKTSTIERVYCSSCG